MKVKVSYTVDMKEVPEEVRLILSKAESKVGKVRRAITKLTDVESSILGGGGRMVAKCLKGELES